MFVSYKQPQKTENVACIAQLINHSLCHISILSYFFLWKTPAQRSMSAVCVCVFYNNINLFSNTVFCIYKYTNKYLNL